MFVSAVHYCSLLSALRNPAARAPTAARCLIYIAVEMLLLFLMTGICDKPGGCIELVLKRPHSDCRLKNGLRLRTMLCLARWGHIKGNKY